MSIVSSALKHSGSIIGVGLAGGFAYSDYRSRVNEGESRGSAAAKVAAENSLWWVAPWAMGAKIVADTLPGVAGAIGDFGKGQAAKQSRAYKNNFGGGFADSNNAYTMRQRGTQAIQNSGMNARSVLGSEARMFYRSSNGI